MVCRDTAVVAVPRERETALKRQLRKVERERRRKEKDEKFVSVFLLDAICRVEDFLIFFGEDNYFWVLINEVNCICG